MDAEEGIRQTLAKYIFRIDDKDVDGVVELFTEEGLLVASAGQGEGHEGIRDFLHKNIASYPAGRKSKHLQESSVIEIDGDTAEALTDIVVFQSYGSAPWATQATNRHADKLVLKHGRWLFSEKRVIDAQGFVSNRPLIERGA